MFRHRFAAILLASLALVSLAVPGRSAQTTDELNSVTERCLATVLKVGGYREFRGAVFESILEDGVHVSEGDIDIFMRLRTRQNRRKSDACSFEAENVMEREFGLHAATVTQDAEGLGLMRTKPFTVTNFTLEGCFEDDVKGPTNLTIRTVYRRKSKVIHFRAESSSGGFSSCGE